MAPAVRAIRGVSEGGVGLIVKVAGNPHNMHQPINLRKKPVCYLCGNAWELYGDHEKGKVVQCSNCKLITCAEMNEQVWDARGWPR